MASLQILPEETMVLILDHCSSAELVRSSMTCRALRTAAEKTASSIIDDDEQRALRAADGGHANSPLARYPPPIPTLDLVGRTHLEQLQMLERTTSFELHRWLDPSRSRYELRVREGILGRGGIAFSTVAGGGTSPLEMGRLRHRYHHHLSANSETKLRKGSHWFVIRIRMCSRSSPHPGALPHNTVVRLVNYDEIPMAPIQGCAGPYAMDVIPSFQTIWNMTNGASDNDGHQGERSFGLFVDTDKTRFSMIDLMSGADRSGTLQTRGSGGWIGFGVSIENYQFCDCMSSQVVVRECSKGEWYAKAIDPFRRRRKLGLARRVSK